MERPVMMLPLAIPQQEPVLEEEQKPYIAPRPPRIFLPFGKKKKATLSEDDIWSSQNPLPRPSLEAIDKWLQLRRDAHGTVIEVLMFVAFLIALTSVAFSTAHPGHLSDFHLGLKDRYDLLACCITRSLGMSVGVFMRASAQTLYRQIPLAAEHHESRGILGLSETAGPQRPPTDLCSCPRILCRRQAPTGTEDCLLSKVVVWGLTICLGLLCSNCTAIK
jgi:hypothetical protein